MSARAAEVRVSEGDVGGGEYVSSGSLVSGVCDVWASGYGASDSEYAVVVGVLTATMRYAE